MREIGLLEHFLGQPEISGVVLHQHDHGGLGALVVRFHRKISENA
jgi:hypothetical protein